MYNYILQTDNQNEGILLLSDSYLEEKIKIETVNYIKKYAP